MNVATPAASGSWAQQEFGAAQLVDERLTKRLIMIAEDFYQQPNASIPQATGTPSRMKAAYRFFANEDVTVEQMLEAHRQRTSQSRLAGRRPSHGADAERHLHAEF